MKKQVTAVLLILVMCVSLFSACSSESEPANTSGGESATQALTITPTPGNQQNIDDLAQQVEDLTAELEALRAQLTLLRGELAGDSSELSDEEAAESEVLLGDLRDENSHGTGRIVQRDWSRYTSPTAKARLSTNQAILYDRLDQLCRDLLKNPSAHMVPKNDKYMIGTVSYKDLKLSDETAYNVYIWFKYNNPQYYFLYNGTAHNGSRLFIYTMPFVVTLESFEDTTNELFDKLDEWSRQCCDDEVTIWQKLVSANKIICENTFYDPAVKNNKSNQKPSPSSNHNQSMYSTLMMDRCICAGYAQTFTAMANSMGLDAITVLSETHGWNMVKMDDGNYYYMDVCWNDEDKGYNTLWIGRGTTNGSDKHHILQADNAAMWAPSVSKNDYKPTSKDLGKETVSLDAPKAKLEAAGQEVVKISWNKVNGAERYEIISTCNGEVTRHVSTKSTCIYLPYAKDAKAMTVQIRSVNESSNPVVSSDWYEFTVTDKGEGFGPDAPSNIRATEVNDKTLSVKWDTPSSENLLFCYGADETMKKILFGKVFGSSVSWTNWNSAEISYFKLISIAHDSRETYSRPVIFSYSKKDGITILDDGINKNQVAVPGNVAIALIPATNDTDRYLSFTWESVTDATGYEFQFSFKEDFSEIAASKICKPTTTGVRLTSLRKNATTYYVRIRTIIGDGNNDRYSDWVSTGYAVPSQSESVTKPAAPSNCSMTENGQNATFTWDTVDHATGYVFTLYKNEEYDDVWSVFNKTENQITLGKFTAGRTYYFTLKAVRTENGIDAYSDEKKFTFTFQGEKLEKPENISVTPEKDQGTFTWNSVEGAAGYRLTLYKDSGYKTIWATYDTEQPSITLGKLQNGKTYYYSVQALGTSADGKEMVSDLTTGSIVFNSLALPGGIKAVSENSKLKVSWDAVEGATGYELILYTDYSRKKVKETFQVTTSYALMERPQSGTTCYFALRAIAKNSGEEVSSPMKKFNVNIK